MVAFVILALTLGTLGYLIKPIVRLMLLLFVVGWVAQHLGFH
jgi:hypothetical protein